MNHKLLKKIIELSNKNIPFCTISQIDKNDVEVITADECDDPIKGEHINNALKEDQLKIVNINDSEFIINPFNPSLRLIIVGAVHISQYLSKIAKLLDFDIIIVDPREAFASKERFPNDKVINSWPEECFQSLKINSRTAVVTLTHEPNLDDPALHFALKSECFYIGALGSKKTHSKRIKRLQENGFNKDEIKRLNGPIGLPINASTPNEIAISIMSEIIATLRHRNISNTELREDWKLR